MKNNVYDNKFQDFLEDFINRDDIPLVHDIEYYNGDYPAVPTIYTDENSLEEFLEKNNVFIVNHNIVSDVVRNFRGGITFIVNKIDNYEMIWEGLVTFRGDIHLLKSGSCLCVFHNYKIIDKREYKKVDKTDKTEDNIPKTVENVEKEYFKNKTANELYKEFVNTDIKEQDGSAPFSKMIYVTVDNGGNVYMQTDINGNVREFAWKENELEESEKKDDKKPNIKKPTKPDVNWKIIKAVLDKEV